MRVIAGAAKGRPLRAPAGERTRPTADRVKEAWFSSLQARLPGAHVLDLFAGSGQLGLEALSRGAAAVTFVERDRRAVQALRANVATVDLPGARVVAGDVADLLRGPLDGSPFDVVVADPPYGLADADLAAVLSALVPHHLAAGAVVTVERARRSGPVAWPSTAGEADGPRYGDVDARRYGDTVLHRATFLEPAS